MVRFLIAVACFLISTDSIGKTFRTLESAVAEIQKGIPGSTVRTETIYLTQDELKQAHSDSGVPVESALVVRKKITAPDGTPSETVYTDTHRVRTHPETVLLRIDSRNEIRRIEVLDFEEPLEYLPRNAWFDRFSGSGLDPELELKRRIPFVTGATLSAHSVLEAVRRTLAIHRVIGKRK